MEENVTEENETKNVESSQEKKLTSKEKFKVYLKGYMKKRYREDPEFRKRMVNAALASRAKKKEHYKKVNDKWRSENKEALKKYNQEWVKRNPEKIKEYREKWKLKLREKRLEEKKKKENI